MISSRINRPLGFYDMKSFGRTLWDTNNNYSFY